MKIKRIICLLVALFTLTFFSSCASVTMTEIDRGGVFEYEFNVNLSGVKREDVIDLNEYLSEVFDVCGYPLLSDLSYYTESTETGNITLSVLQDENFMPKEAPTLRSRNDGFFYSEYVFETENPLYDYATFYNSGVSGDPMSYSGLSRVVAVLKKGYQYGAKAVPSLSSAMGTSGTVGDITVKYAFQKKLFMSSDKSRQGGYFVAELDLSEPSSSPKNNITYTRRQPNFITWYVFIALAAGAFVVIALLKSRKSGAATGVLVDETETERKRIMLKKVIKRGADFAPIPPRVFRKTPDSDLYESVEETHESEQAPQKSENESGNTDENA